MDKSCSAISSPPEVIENIESLADKVEQIRSAIDTLYSKLNGVLSESLPQETAKEPAHRSSCQLSRFLIDIEMSTDIAIYQLKDIRNRLCI